MTCQLPLIIGARVTIIGTPACCTLYDLHLPVIIARILEEITEQGL